MSTAVARRTNLPAELSSFVGRRHELTELRSALGEHRLVTLHGPGGVGKTRLAVRSAAEQQKSVRDGAWFVELAPVPVPELVADTVIGALGLREAQSGPPLDRLIDQLRGRELLLVLDNCEHVQEAAAQVAAQLLAQCPGVTVIATTRHALGVDGEHLLAVPPLPMPSAEKRVKSPEALMHYDSVRLFLDRATASWPSFEVDRSNQEAIAELVRRLDGMPLAIELAAVRVRSLSVQQILHRLSDRFALLTRGNRAALPRQQTLRALIDWSYDLLDHQERLVWERATVFSGSFDLAAAGAVLCGDELPADRLPELLESLVSKSIMLQEDTESAPRWHMLESIQEYGCSQLERAGASATYGDRHRRYYADLVATAAVEMYGPEQVTWFQRLRHDHDNLRTALEAFVRDQNAHTAGLRMAAALQHYWVMVGRFSEGRSWLARLLSGTTGEGIERAAGLEVTGRLAVLQGDLELGRPMLEQALAMATGAGDKTWRAHALHGLALASVFWGEPAQAVPRLEEALALHREGSDPFGVPLALVQLATVHATLGEPDRAMEYAEECTELSEKGEERWCAALARWTQALVVWREGKYSRVRTYAREVLRLKEPFGDRMGMAMSMEVVAWAESMEGRHPEAARLLGAVSVALQSIGASLFGHLIEDHDRCVEHTRAALGPENFQTAFDEGAALSFEQAVVLAMGAKRAKSATAEPATDGVRLTKRERQIAELVAKGMTNRDVAAALFLSPRTAEGHVARLLRKLGFTSRDQLAGWISEHS